MNQNANTVMVTFDPPVDGVESSFHVRFETALEMVHILGMGKWESTAPPPGKTGLRGGIELENSQQARLQYLLEGIGKVEPERTYSTLAVKTRNPRAFGSKITKQKPAQGLALQSGWYLDCCLNLEQKLEIVDALRHVGYSSAFVEIARRFVAGRSICQAEI